VEQQEPAEYLAECFWPGVKRSDLAALDQRAEASAAELTSHGHRVRYLGSLLMLDDEVVFCGFEGSELSVHRAVELAAIPYERILKATRSPWQAGPLDKTPEHN
jgi:hypothetical protein